MWTNFPILVLLVTLASCQDMVTTGPPHETGDATPPLEKTQIKPVIRSLRITSNIKYRYSTTLVSTRVVNPSNQPGEATFTVTLPESAFISEFLMEVKDKVYKAYVKEKEEAKAIYQDAVQAGQFAGHVALDARDSNQFTVSVNIEAHGKVTFNLTYEQLLSRNLGVYSNVININPQQVVEDMKVIVDIEEPSAIVDLEVPELQLSNEAIPEKHNEYAKIEDKGPNHKQVIWAPTSDEQKSKNITGLSGQFIVRYDVDREGNSQQILVDEGYFVHFFAPENLPKLKKHVIFVLDFSGSMGGRKLEQLKEAMKQIFSDLEPKDYFSIVIFQSWVEVWSPAGMHITSQPEHISHWQSEQFEAQNKNGTLDSKYVVQATPANIELARTFMEHYSDLGSTNIMGGLRTALKIVDIGEEQWTNESDPPHPVLVFLTDGQPNVEEYDTNVIITKTTALNTKQIPIFSLAFGYGADFNFLRKLSLQNFGFARNIYEAADATQQLKNFYQTIASPLLSDVTFHYLPGQVDNSSNTKQEFPVFFSGSELVVAGRVNKNNIADGNTIGELRGTTATGPQTFPIIIRHVIVKPQNRTIGHLEKAWSYLTIQQLLDKSDSLDSGEEKNQTRKKALDLALQYAFVTPLTSLVVVKPNETESAVDATKVKPGGVFESALYALAPQAAHASGFQPLILSGSPSASYPGVMGRGSVGAFGNIKLRKTRPNATSLKQHYAIYLRHSAMGKTSAQGQSRHHMHSSGRVASRFPAPSQPPPPPRYSSDDDINGGQLYDLRSSPDLDSFATHGDSGGGLVMVKVKVPLEDVKWLQKVLNATSTIKSVTVEGNNYKLGINETNSSFGNCNVNNESGECHHLQYCVLSDFQDDISQFLPFKCHIPGDYLGVCCPKYLV